MSSKMHYRSVEENKDYILVNVKYDIARMTVYEDIEKDVYSEFQSIYFKLFVFERENQIGYLQEPIALRKDSLSGKYILSHPEIWINDDEQVTYDKVVNAYSVATFEDNTKMANKILPLFKGRVSGSRDELSDICSLNVLDFILSNGDFKEYLKKKDGKVNNQAREYFVYEDGEYNRRVFDTEKGKVKVKSSVND